MREVCGFEEDSGLPHRTTFNRFFTRLSDHHDLVQDCLNQVTSQLQVMLPGFGDEVAIDSTDVQTHCNPNKRSKLTDLPSDPEARWGVKHSARSKKSDKTEYFFGYKVHMVADATYDVPITFKVTAGNRNDSPELPAVMDKAFAEFDWFDPSVATADRGYDATSNFEYLYTQHGIDPVISYPQAHCQRRPVRGYLHEGRRAHLRRDGTHGIHRTGRQGRVDFPVPERGLPSEGLDAGRDPQVRYRDCGRPKGKPAGAGRAHSAG